MEDKEERQKSFERNEQRNAIKMCNEDEEQKRKGLSENQKNKIAIQKSRTFTY